MTGTTLTLTSFSRCITFPFISLRVNWRPLTIWRKSASPVASPFWNAKISRNSDIISLKPNRKWLSLRSKYSIHYGYFYDFINESFCSLWLNKSERPFHQYLPIFSRKVDDNDMNRCMLEFVENWPCKIRHFLLCIKNVRILFRISKVLTQNRIKIYKLYTKIILPAIDYGVKSKMENFR